jgi:hypothetical protein
MVDTGRSRRGTHWQDTTYSVEELGLRTSFGAVLPLK